MGMFDWVSVEVPLPDGWNPPEHLQSKDFDCEMTIIRVGQRLKIERFEYETVPREQRPYPDAEKGSLRALCGMFRKVNRKWEDLNFHGIFNFYGSEDTGKLLAVNMKDGTCAPIGEEPQERAWHEYFAKYTDGQLVGVFADEALERGDA